MIRALGVRYERRSNRSHILLLPYHSLNTFAENLFLDQESQNKIELDDFKSYIFKVWGFKKGGFNISPGWSPLNSAIRDYNNGEDITEIRYLETIEYLKSEGLA